MAERLLSLDPVEGRLPDVVRAQLAADMGDPSTVEGAQLSATFAAAVSSVASGLGAVDPNNVGYDIVLLLGQSNMAGWASDGPDARLDPTSDRIWQYSSRGTYQNTINQAIEPLDMVVDAPPGIGPGVTFARWYADTVPANRLVLLVPVAKGGTPFEGDSAPTAGWTWKVGRVDVTNLYENAITQASAALTAAGPNSRIVAALWVHGETDGDNGTTGPTYQADLDALINGLRSRLSLPSLPFIVGQMVPEYLGTGTRTAINAVHVSTPARLMKTAFAAGAVGLNRGDGNHYNAAGQRVNGRRLLDAYQRAIAPATIVDDFTRANSTTSLGVSTSGHVWTVVSGTWGIDANRAYQTASTDDVKAVIGSLPADCYVGATQAAINGFGLILRYQDASNYYLAVSHNGFPGGNGIVIFKKVGGAYTALFTNAAATSAPGDAFRFAASGKELRLTKNGVVVASASDASFAGGGPVGLRFGLGGNSAGLATRWDDFKAGGL